MKKVREVLPHKLEPRSYGQSFLLAVIAIYLPAVLPLLLTPLTNHGQVFEQYLKLLVIGPGVAAAVFIPYSDSLFVMGIVTALLILFMTLTARFLRGRELAVIYSPSMALLGILYYAVSKMLL
jgi:hypothetical protein